MGMGVGMGHMLWAWGEAGSKDKGAWVRDRAGARWHCVVGQEGAHVKAQGHKKIRRVWRGG